MWNISINMHDITACGEKHDQDISCKIVWVFFKLLKVYPTWARYLFSLQAMWNLLNNLNEIAWNFASNCMNLWNLLINVPCDLNQIIVTDANVSSQKFDYSNHIKCICPVKSTNQIIKYNAFPTNLTGSIYMRHHFHHFRKGRV